MKESISTTLILGIVLTFFSILLLLLASSSAYSKAFKVRNRIIEMIESNQGFSSGVKNQSDLILDIENELSKFGYRINTSVYPDCGKRAGNNLDGSGEIEPITFTSKYNFCVYKYKTDRGSYYGVLTYMYFDIPVVDNIKIGVYGETKTLYDLTEFQEEL